MAVTGPWTTVIVPTVGRSPWLADCLESLRRSGGDSMEIFLVAQGMAALKASDEVAKLADRTFYLYDSIGFAAANNHAFEAASGEFVALVNDDVVVHPDWYPLLIEALDQNKDVAAVQGVNLQMTNNDIIDGCGIVWNNFWQAIQLGHGSPREAAPKDTTEVFGVSATAALYRRKHLIQVDLAPAGSAPRIFDEKFYSYYEDVDLACRLQGIGSKALVVPAAIAEHAGSTSGIDISLGTHRLIYCNRYLALARFLGNRFFSQLPRIWRRDFIDTLQAIRRTDASRAAAILAGCLRAAIYLPGFLHSGRPALSIDEIRSFMIDR